MIVKLDCSFVRIIIAVYIGVFFGRGFYYFIIKLFVLRLFYEVSVMKIIIYIVFVFKF